MEQIIEAQLLKNKRPTLLTILCILTFIGNGWKIAKNIIDCIFTCTVIGIKNSKLLSQAKNIIDCIFTCTVIGIKNSKLLSQSVQTYAEALKEVAVTDTIAQSEVSPESFNAVVDVFSSYFIYPLAIPFSQNLFLIISIIGAILMFNLKRKGFYIYTVAQILYLVATLYFMGFSSWALFFISTEILIILLFLILFAVNLKYMRA